jgi:hypothetical protein
MWNRKNIINHPTSWDLGGDFWTLMFPWAGWDWRLRRLRVTSCVSWNSSDISRATNNRFQTSLQDDCSLHRNRESPTHRLFQTKASSRIEHLEVPHVSCGNMLLTSIRLESKSVDLFGHPASWSRRIQGEAIRPAHPEAHQTRYRPLNWGKTKLQTGKPMDSEMDCFYDMCLDIFGICCDLSSIQTVQAGGSISFS